MVSEDFGYYAQRVPTTFWFLGVRPPGARDFPTLHHPEFDFPDEAAPLGIRLHCELALQFARLWPARA